MATRSGLRFTSIFARFQTVITVWWVLNKTATLLSHCDDLYIDLTVSAPLFLPSSSFATRIFFKSLTGRIFRKLFSDELWHAAVARLYDFFLRWPGSVLNLRTERAHAWWLLLDAEGDGRCDVWMFLEKGLLGEHLFLSEKDNFSFELKEVKGL